MFTAWSHSWGRMTGGQQAARRAGKQVSRQASGAVGRDALRLQGSKLAESLNGDLGNPAFAAAMAEVRKTLAQRGQYANVSTGLRQALSQASTTQEALEVATLARKLSVAFNQANRGALKEALEVAAGKAQLHDEAFAVLSAVVKTREEAYALFRLAEKRKLVETAVGQYMAVGGLPTEELATKAIRLTKARLDQDSTRETIRRVVQFETEAERVRTITNFMHKALS
ncbi:MAG: hypothetical protein VKP62_09350 [Candidatus Sericytochromatia bacterium]|nr:hypothetical protein [Candidatus Sericytochromatia bacterium]